MKYTILSAIALLGLTITGCKKSADNSNSTSSILTKGDWKITYYYDSDHEETSNYSAYTFQFGRNGSLTGQSSSEAGNGTWNSGNDDSQEKLIFHFNNPAILVQLNNDWHVKMKSNSRMELEDVSGGNGSTDYLTFEKK